jgi:hypothetical protein
MRRRATRCPGGPLFDPAPAGALDFGELRSTGDSTPQLLTFLELDGLE